MENSKRLKEIVYSEKMGTADWTQDFASALYLQRCKRSDVYIWGIDYDLPALIKLLNNEELNVVAIFDSISSNYGKSILGVPIINPTKCEPKKQSFCFILSGAKKSNRFSKKVLRVLSKLGLMNEMDNNIINQLNRIGINDFYYITHHDKDLIFQNQGYDWDAGRQEYYKEKYFDLEKLMNYLADETSVEIFIEYIRTYCENDLYRLQEGLFKYKYFYGNNEKELLYKQYEDEVWINCGAGKGETVFAFISEHISFSKILCVDEDKRALEKLKNGISQLSDEIKNKISVIEKRISSSDDLKEIANNERITLINADIEGAEYSLLDGCIDTIVAYRPVLAICVYHKREDLINIPMYLHDKLSDYKFYLRKYVATSANKRRNSELVLYAVPEERCIV